MSDWVKAREFATRFEAEVARAWLESAAIPTMIKAHEAGLFGAGFQGPVTSGVELHVPTGRLADVDSILGTKLGSGVAPPTGQPVP
jgi:hypothetical protein